MSLRFKPAVVVLFTMLAILGCAGGAGAAVVSGLLPFAYTGNDSPSHYSKGEMPDAELLLASDGNFYGTTANGGSGLCPNDNTAGYQGCGVIFKIDGTSGVETVLYNFPFDTVNNTAPDGAFPAAGLIQGKDGALYGVAADGGIPACLNVNGCGTLFRITTSGVFTLLHQFCGSTGCPGIDEGSDPEAHLVQAADGTLYGTTYRSGDSGAGTLFSATTFGAVTTLHEFAASAGDPVGPFAALLIGRDSNTLYGTTEFGGADSKGTVFSYGLTGLTIIHSFGVTDTAASPDGALIYGADGLLYGTTSTGATGGTLFSINTAGGAFAVDTTFPSGTPLTGLLLGSDGMMYGTLYRDYDIDQNGALFMYDPATKVMQTLFGFGRTTGGGPRGVLIEGKDRRLYGTNSFGGRSGGFGITAGTVYQLGPPLAK